MPKANASTAEINGDSVANGTSDPILDEVAHRLAALESQQEKPDKAHTEKLASRLDEIERRISGISPVDPRTDDLVIRTASLEAAAKNTRPPDQLQEALQRVRQVEAAVGASTTTSSRSYPRGLPSWKTAQHKKPPTPASTL